MKIVIIGGVAGGANVATRARRLSEEAEIIVFEKGGYVSFANCGLPYHIGGEIKSRSALLMATPESLKARYNIDVKVRSEVTHIKPEQRKITVKNLLTQSEYEESYDELIISTGALPIRPNLPGLSRDGVFVLRDMDDMDGILTWIEKEKPKRAVVVGGGFIGVEVAEQLHALNMKISLLEGSPQLLAPLDPEMASFIHKEVISKGVELVLNDPLSSIEENGSSKVGCVVTKSGKKIETDLVIMGIGVKPNISLAKEAGLTIGSSGAISVNEFLETSKEHIWALGDAIEIAHPVLGTKSPIPLAGPANRQGRIIADNILLGKKTKFTGGLGTAIARVFSLTAAATGANEKQLKNSQKVFSSVFIHPNNHAGYYPGASSMAVKLIFDPETSKILGGQIIGKDGVDKRIDVLATAIKGGLKVDDLIDLELSYAPPFSSAKDPINIAGMAAQNVLRELVETEHPGHFSPETFNGVILDVRDSDEVEKGSIKGAQHIPLNELRTRMNELSKEKPLVVYCQSGMRSYLACRILKENGFTCKNLSGAFKSWSQAQG